MEYSNCPRCGKLFLRTSGALCPLCEKEEEKQFDGLRKFIDDHPECSIAMVSEETGVPMKRILRYVREGRLEMSMGMVEDSDLKCISCGTPIRIGTYCTPCQLKLQQSVQEMMTDSIEKKKNSGMHNFPR